MTDMTDPTDTFDVSYGCLCVGTLIKTKFVDVPTTMAFKEFEESAAFKRGQATARITLTNLLHESKKK